MNKETLHRTEATADKQAKCLIKYITPEKVWVGLPFINTQGKLLHLGLPYLKHENWLADSRTEAVRILDIWEIDGILNVKVQSLTTFEVNTLIWNLDYSGTDGKWMWSLADLQSIMESE